jgi:hypothetical protein
MFISTVAEDAAEGTLAELYAQQRAAWGFLPDYPSPRPEPWRHGVGALDDLPLPVTRTPWGVAERLHPMGIRRRSTPVAA